MTETAQVSADTTTASAPVETTTEVSRETASEVEEVISLDDENQTQEEAGAGSHGETDKKPEPLKFKRTVDGKVVEATEDELWKHYGLAVTANERLKAASQRQKELDEREARVNGEKDALARFFEEMQKKPERAFELLNKMGHDAKKIARQMVLEDLEYERMTPEQKELLELRRKTAQFEEEKKAIEQKEIEHQEALVKQEFTQQLDNVLSEAVKLTGLKPTAKTVARLAEACQTLLSASKTGDLPTADQIVKKFRSWMNQDASEMIGEQDVDKLVELGLLNPKSIERIVKWHLDKNKANLPSFSGASKKAAATKQSENQKPQGVNEFFRKFGA